MPYFSVGETETGGAIKLSDEMEQPSTAPLMAFQVSETLQSEQLLNYETIAEDYENIAEDYENIEEEYENIEEFGNIAEDEIIDTMGAASDMVVPFSEQFDDDGAPILSYNESLQSKQLTTYENKSENEVNVMCPPPDVIIPQPQNFDHEVIAISDDEEEDMRRPEFLVKPSQRPIFPVFRQSRVPVPMAPLSNIAENSEIITLSDDDDAARPHPYNMKRKKSSRRGRTMFNPQICPFCRKEKRDNICMAKHLIRHHWQRIRAHNSGNHKGTDYWNIKDDREIPLDRQKEEKPRYTPLPPSLPPMPPPNSYRQRDNAVYEQPLKPSFMRNMPPPYSNFPGNPNNGSIFDKSGSFSHLPSQPIKSSVDIQEVRKESVVDLGHPDNRKLVREQLGMLMHAHKCEGRNTTRKQNSFFQESKDCTLPGCKDTKEVLKHLPTCVAETDCPVPKCFESKQIIQWALSAQSPGVLSEMRNELNRQAKAGLPQDVVQWALKHPFDREQWKSWREKKLKSTPNISNQGMPINNLPTTLLNMKSSFPPSQPMSGTVTNTGQPNMNTPPNTSPSVPSSLLSLLNSQKKPISAELREESPKPDPPTQAQGVAGGAGYDPPTQAQTPGQKPISDWKKKYIEAAEKRRGNQVTKRPNVPQSDTKTDKVIPSKAPVDFLSGLLSSQSATAELRKVRKPEPIIDKRYQNVNKRPTPSSTAKQLPNPIPNPPLQAATSGQDAAMYNSMLSL